MARYQLDEDEANTVLPDVCSAANTYTVFKLNTNVDRQTYLHEHLEITSGFKLKLRRR